MKLTTFLAAIAMTGMATTPVYANPSPGTVAAPAVEAAAPAKQAKPKKQKKVAEAQKVTPSGEPIICKSQLETGSLVRKKKRCYTQAEWDRIAQAARARGERLVTDSTGGEASN